MTLSPRQQEIAALVVEGLSNKAIGKRLNLSHHSVGTYLYRMGKRIEGQGSPRAKAFRWWYEVRRTA